MASLGPGKVSYAVVTAGGLPILTGEMTGCWLVLFIERPNLLRHIGTEAFKPENSLKAKNAWKVAVGRGIVQPLRPPTPSIMGCQLRRPWPGFQQTRTSTIRCDVEGGAYGSSRQRVYRSSIGARKCSRETLTNDE
jgi:hypothetical protein